MARARKSIRPDPYQKPLLKKLSPEQSKPGELPQFLEPTRANFDLQSAYGAAGDQPAAIRDLTEGFERGERFQCLLGVTGSGKTFTMANVIKNVGKPTLVLTHNKTLAAQLYQEFKTFFPNNAVEYFVSYYDYYQPEAYIVHTDTYIEKDAAINDEIDKLRLRATSNLLTRYDYRGKRELYLWLGISAGIFRFDGPIESGPSDGTRSDFDAAGAYSVPAK